ncbi:hypothetical protein ACHBGV_09045 [Streptococcus sp. A34]|uniref:hypothetical protein n=1 Tax=Streptococcus TaxID=1301 RepID=UPI000CF44B82|nr:hypothetical protein [Streptococcus suis]
MKLIEGMKMTDFERDISFFEALDEKNFSLAHQLYEEGVARLDDAHISGHFWLRNQRIYLAIAEKEMDLAKELAQANLVLAREHSQAEEFFLRELQPVALRQVADVEREAGNYQQALEFLEEEASLLFEDNESQLVGNTYEQAYLHFLMGDMELAEQEMRKVLKEAARIEFPYLEASANRVLGEITKECSYFERAKELYLEVDDQISAQEVEQMVEAVAKQ